MRVLIAHNDYGRPSGEEHAVETTADLLAQHGHQVVWLRKSSASIMKSPVGHAKAFFSGIHSVRAKRQIESLLDRQRIDVLHVQNLYPLLSPSILSAARCRGVPVVMRCPNYRLFCPSGLHMCRSRVCERCLGGKEWWCVIKNCEGNYVKSLGYAVRNATARISRSILDNVTKFVVLSQFQRERFSSSGVPENKIEILHNFVETPVTDDVGELGHTIAFVGRPREEKGIDLFLKAAAALPEYCFAVAGDTASCPGIERRAPANVRFHGFLQNVELDAFCRDMRMLVVPSLCFDSFPNSILRAMSFGKPVLCSRFGALPEIVIDGQTGLLHTANSLDELVSHIKRLYRAPDLCRRFGENGQHRARTRYSSATFYDRLMSIYESAIAIMADRDHTQPRS